MSVTRKESILPMTFPMVTLYATHANALSVLESHKGTLPWLLNRFVQLVCWDKKWPDYLDFNYRSCPLLDYQRIDKKFIQLQWDNNCTKFTRDAIDSGFYVSMLLNSNLIPAYFQGSYHCHELFIYGYDEYSREFYIADNFDFGRYQYKKCTFEDLDNAYKNTSALDERSFYGAPEAIGAIQLISFKEQENLSFNSDQFMDSLEDYLHGTVPRSGFNQFNYKPNTYGCMAAYTAAIDNVNEIIDKPNSFLDIRKFHVLWEHKSIMLKRFSYLSENRIWEDAQVYEKYRNMERKLLLARNLILKYALTQNKKMLEEATVSYKELLTMDLEYTNDLFHRLKLG